MPEVSIIVPVYNIEAYIADCLDSLLAQSFKDFEALLIDDGSTDSSGRICDEYAAKDGRFIVYHKTNGGLGSARNYGLERAQGEWIAHVDGDDWVEPDMLETLLRTAEEKGAEIAFGDFQMVFNDRKVPYRLPKWEGNKAECLGRYIAYPWTCVWGSIAKRSIYTRFELRSPEDITYCEDFHLIIRLCRFAKKVAHTDRVLYNYRQRESSIMRGLSRKTMEDEQKTYLYMIGFFQSLGEYKLYKKPLNWRLLKSGQDLLLSPDTHKDFLALCPDIKKDIWDCPLVGSKIKLMAWLLTHNLRPLLVIINKLRKWAQR